MLPLSFHALTELELKWRSQMLSSFNISFVGITSPEFFYVEVVACDSESI